KDSVQKNKRKPVLSPTHQEGSPSVSDTTASSFRGPFDPRANELEEEDAGAADHTLKRRRRGQRQDEEALDAMGRSGTPSTDQSDLGSHRHRKSRKLMNCTILQHGATLHIKDLDETHKVKLEHLKETYNETKRGFLSCPLMQTEHP
ncbi:unnamed protein product, partial [Dibothriocephalus latus]